MHKRWLRILDLILATAVAITLGHGTSSFAATFTSPMRPLAGRNAPVNYGLVELPTLGGAQDFANFINDRDWVTGAADLTGGQIEHAFLWQDGHMLDLGTLGGPNSLAWPVNDAGEVAGDSITSTPDPLKENFCNFNIDGVAEFTDRTCLGFAWLHGVMTPLPTLGGNNGQVFGLNNRGQIAGTAEVRRPDPSCVLPQVLDWKPVVWGPGAEIQQLRVFPGDSVGAVLAINDFGQAVGGSGMCGPLNPPASVHPLLWEGHTVTYLGGFGGAMSNAAFDINNRGQVVGFSDLPGDTTTHAFLWQNGKMTDLGTLAGDFASFAFGINDRGQVVGQSCDINFNCRAFVWQDGVMSDLNSLINPRSALYLMLAESINAGGQITGIAFNQSTGGVPAFIAIPAIGYGVHPSSRANLPAGVRKRLQHWWGLGIK